MSDPSQYPQDPYGRQYPPGGQPTTRIDPQGQYSQGDQYPGYSGQPPGGQYSGYGGQPTPPPGRPTSVTAVVGLVLAFVVSPVGIVVSALGLRDTRDGRKAGRGMAIAGVIIGVVGTLLWIAAIIAGVFLVRLAASTYDDVATQISSGAFTDLPSDLPTDFATDLPTDGGDFVDATSDAQVTDCYDDGEGTAYGEVTVTNSGTTASTYVVNVYAYDEDGTKIGELGAVTDEIEPGDEGTAQAGGYIDEGTTIASCEVEQAIRE